LGIILRHGCTPWPFAVLIGLVSSWIDWFGVLLLLFFTKFKNFSKLLSGLSTVENSD